MAIISFWSTENEQVPKAESIVAIATFLAIQHNFKILVLDTNFKNYFYQDSYWQDSKAINLIKGSNSVGNVTSGINGLARAVLSNKTSPEIVTNYTKIVFKDRLEVLTGTKLNKEDYNICKRAFREIVRMANKYYDLVIVDINEELDENIKDSLLEISDIIVVNISQRIRQINNFMKIKQEHPILSKKNVIPLLDRYDKYSKYNTKNVARYIKEKKGVYAIPYNTLFFEACNEGRVADFFIKFRKMNSKDLNSAFIDSVGQFAENIIYRLQELQMRM